ncbi:armadillo-type protein [Abortiporus biennis]|nr:armadillo-type protein [Abortiporus biennis]
MFKSILPSRKVPSDDEFQMITAPVEPTQTTGKENHPAMNASTSATKKGKKNGKAKDPVLQDEDVEQKFCRLMDDLQIPPTLRPKLATMEPSVKAAMLKSSHVLATALPSVEVPKTPARGLRKANSMESLTSPKPHSKQPSGDDYDLFRSTRYSNLPANDPNAGPAHVPPYAVPGHSRGKSLDVRKDHDTVRSTATHSQLPNKKGKDKSSKDASQTPAKMHSLLMNTSSLQLNIEVVKKLRIYLRNEAASWTFEFVNLGGYNAILTRLDEILNVEWREEQHDDQLLHELLRCFKALETSAAGCHALRSRCPRPYPQLMTLLYSDKKPGEVGTRQLIVEMLLALFDLYPPSSLPGLSNSPRSYAHARSQSTPWESDPSSSNIITLPPQHATLYSFIRSLLLTPAPPPTENPKTPVTPHDFIEELHVPRIYKTYLRELNDLCRDYFWVFCHPSNTIWNLDDVDEVKVEKPRAPGGMTGGVEFEAMSYMTIHFKFLNAVAKIASELKVPREHELSAYNFHKDMFLSGIERVLLIARKASTTYYPTLHLEISRYISLALQASFELPWSISRLIGHPPSGMRRNHQQTSSGKSTVRSHHRPHPAQTANTSYATNNSSVYSAHNPHNRSKSQIDISSTSLLSGASIIGQSQSQSNGMMLPPPSPRGMVYGNISRSTTPAPRHANNDNISNGERGRDRERERERERPAGARQRSSSRYGGVVGSEVHLPLESPQLPLPRKVTPMFG